ncbi:MAG TPA: heavy metal-binding domain-containing protein [Oscillatoriaceae cyanobacterium]
MNIWPFGNKEADEEKKRQKALQQQAQAEQAESLAAMERGGLPLKARKRLQESQAGPRKLFTSDFSTNEFLLIKEAGYEPLGLVVGTAFFKVGFFDFYTAPAGFGELGRLVQARAKLRATAIKRLEDEAKLLGAHGVIGVEIEARSVDWSNGLMEYAAVGTAIRVPGRPLPERPFTCDLSAQEFQKLRAAGYWPLALVYGISVQYVPNRFYYGFTWGNTEMTDVSQAFAAARHQASHRLDAAARQLGAEGVVGSEIEFFDEEIEYEVQRGDDEVTQRDLMVEFLARGTAIAPDPHPLPAPSASPLVMMTLNPRA